MGIKYDPVEIAGVANV